MLTFPLDISSQWHQNFTALDSSRSEWLLETGSLTAKLKQTFSEFSVKVLSETRIMLTESQAKIMGIEQQTALCREVILYGDSKPRVYAQSWIPLAPLAENSLFLSLGERPLGEFIFQHPDLVRENLMITDFTKQSALQTLLTSLAIEVSDVPARRSIFHLADLKLMVCEAFLPGAFDTL
ncbi:chorismate--pyruvate lyase family protein [Pseudoalteromonas sp. G4]|uniref:chorismate--pyruvate lyase family protein n=1 Tax=Pseudoalteromonas sp. G4 TaxID=2992761 RepID=UPI00237E2AC6|nr:chorismate lyase [Pseudoalteromonas sp. G4]MDE3272954.1 chorismate lyase [Pseudoalteromonas sp. G4]